jgi:arsenate reductase (glutaredoxin)
MKIYHLSNCSTCKRIINELGANSDNCELSDLKKESITETQLDWLAQQAGSYEALFSRKSMKYRPMGLHEKTLTEQDYKKLMLEEYSFLKRPIVIINEKAFVGNQAKTVEAAKEALKIQ